MPWYDADNKQACREVNQLWRHEKRIEYAAASSAGVPPQKFKQMRKENPMVTFRPCLQCNATKDVSLHFSNTQYGYNERDRAAGKKDSNGPHPMCVGCQSIDDEHWAEMWADLHRDILGGIVDADADAEGYQYQYDREVEMDIQEREEQQWREDAERMQNAVGIFCDT